MRAVPFIVALLLLASCATSYEQSRVSWHRCTTYYQIPADWVTRCAS